MAKLTDEERGVILDALIENEAIEEGEREAILSLSDSSLTAFATNALESHDEDEEDEEEEETVEEEATENMKGKKKLPEALKKHMKKKKGAKAADDEEDEEEEEETTDNAAAPTMDEWMQNAPPEIQSVVQNAMQVEAVEKTKLIKQLTANMSAEDKKHMTHRFNTTSVQDLRDLTKIQPKVTENSAPPTSRFNFQGAGNTSAPTGNTAHSQKHDDRPLMSPTINWAEETHFNRTAKSN
jgi:hypothetical protein